MHLLLISTLFILNLPSLIAAQCPACTSYTAALDTCQSQTTSANLTMTGTKLDTATVKCMCVSGSNTAQLNTCQGCLQGSILGPGEEGYVDPLLLLSWYNVCGANDKWGEEQGAACWQSQPGSYLPCVSNTVKKSGGSTASGSTAGGDAAASSPTPASSSKDTQSSAAKRSYEGIASSVVLFVSLAMGVLA
ncbi:MAG: hypothetical protein Q9168_004031 [Polycauliona sp. 1 TL-2023]